MPPQPLYAADGVLRIQRDKKGCHKLYLCPKAWMERFPGVAFNSDVSVYLGTVETFSIEGRLALELPAGWAALSVQERSTFIGESVMAAWRERGAAADARLRAMLLLEDVGAPACPHVVFACCMLHAACDACSMRRESHHIARCYAGA
jgi:hypothetical protein